MTHSPDYPPSPEYQTRQAARQQALDREREKLTWTDEQFLAERDAAYVALQRCYVAPTITSIQRAMNDDGDTEGYVRKYHTDEG